MYDSRREDLVQLARLFDEFSEGPLSRAEFERLLSEERIVALSVEVLRRWKETPEQWEGSDNLLFAKEWGAELRVGDLERIVGRLELN